MPSFRIHPAEVSNPDQGAATEVPGKYTADDQKPNKVVVLLSRIVGVTPYAPSMLTDLLICIPKHPVLLEIAEPLPVYRRCFRRLRIVPDIGQSSMMVVCLRVICRVRYRSASLSRRCERWRRLIRTPGIRDEARALAAMEARSRDTTCVVIVLLGTLAAVFFGGCRCAGE